MNAQFTAGAGVGAGLRVQTDDSVIRVRASRAKGGALALSPVVLTSLAINVPGGVDPRHAFEARRRDKLTDQREKWEARAKEMGEAGDRPREKYAAQRAQSLGRDLMPRIGRCGTRARGMLCGCGHGCDHMHRAKRAETRYLHADADEHNGARSVRSETHVKFRCRQHLVCETCLKKRAHRLRAKMAAGLAFALESAREAWRRGGCRKGGRPQIVLVTLTIAHSGDVAKDRDELAEGWRELYRRLNRRGWSRPYCGAWEATSGRDGLGHVHLHLAIVWPFVPWDVVRRLWLASCPRSKSIDMSGKGIKSGKDGKSIKPRRDGKPTNAWSAAKYIGKYIGKGADLSTLGPELAADIVAATYNKHTVITSRKFWQPWERPMCARCGVQPWADEVPFPEPTFAEREVLRERLRDHALAEIREAWLEGQDPQYALPLGTRAQHN